MRLNKSEIKNTAVWEAAQIQLPKFDLDQIAVNTKTRPEWVHFGAGNIFRGFIANAYQKILDQKKADTGIIAVEAFDYEVIDRVYKPFDNLSLLVLMNAKGEFDKTVIGSIAEAITTDRSRTEDAARLVEIFENPSLQMVSFTITEKGYALTDASGSCLDAIMRDLEAGPEHALHTMSVITALSYRRFRRGSYPLTYVSMDNCSHNGDKLKNAILFIAKDWCKRGFAEEAFIDYLEDESKVAFPLTMIDKITPRPSESMKEVLEQLGLEEMDVMITAKKSYMAAFVNAEISEYLVIEDKFTNGRPNLEEAGVIFTDRETVNKVETMKVTTCLNPLHTALAVYGCLLGYTLIAEEMKDEDLLNLVQVIGYEEGLKVVVDPQIINPKQFLDEVIYERLANPFIPDMPQRIATDTSQKVGIRYGETIKSYQKRDDLDSSKLTAIPLSIAAWCRYLLAIDDEGCKFAVSPDPLLEDLQRILAGVQLGDTESRVREILSNDHIFGVNLYEVGLGCKIESMFYEMLQGTGAVRRTLRKYLGM